MAVETSPAATRHSVKLSGTPAVSRAPGSIPLMVTVALGSGASTLTPSSSGSLTEPLWLRTISVETRCCG